MQFCENHPKNALFSLFLALFWPLLPFFWTPDFDSCKTRGVPFCLAYPEQHRRIVQNSNSVLAKMGKIRSGREYSKIRGCSILLRKTLAWDANMAKFTTCHS